MNTPETGCDPLNRLDPGQIDELAGRFGLPLHIIFKDRIALNAKAFRETLRRNYPNSGIFFAVKSNPCSGSIRSVRELDLGVDVVSEYELAASIKESIPPRQIICNGNAKTDDYIDLAVKTGCLVAVDSEWELELLAAAANRYKTVARGLLRIAGMPLEGLTAAEQSTASSWTKFGFRHGEVISVFQSNQHLKSVEMVGISAHIGTQICDPDGYDRLLRYLLSIAKNLIEAGMNLKYIDIGGGFPVNYLSHGEWDVFCFQLREQISGRLKPSEWVTWDGIKMGYAHTTGRILSENEPWIGKGYWSPYPGAKMLDYLLSGSLESGETVSKFLKRIGEPQLIVEPGRALFGTAGITVCRVMGVKDVMGNPVIVVDLGIVNHGTVLVTPDIYPAEILPTQEGDKNPEVFIAGRLCFTGDMISKVKIKLNRIPKRGDLLVLHNTGAYCADHFASNSCGFPMPSKIAISTTGEVEVWRNRREFE